MKKRLLERESQKMATSKPSKSQQIAGFQDNRPSTALQMKLKNAADESPQVRKAAAMQALADSYSERNTFQMKKNNDTGLPDNLKSGIENLSGHSLDDVRVHYNSDKPAQLQAHAFAQGTDIHLASGQEKHLAHEAWHVVQQKQGRVKPTMQMKGNVNVNDDKGLEKEADVMGAKALQMKSRWSNNVDKGMALQMKKFSGTTVQRESDCTCPIGGDCTCPVKGAEEVIKVKATLTPPLESYLKAEEIAYTNVKGWLKVGKVEFTVTKAQHDALVAKGLIEDRNGPASLGPNAADSAASY